MVGQKAMTFGPSAKRLVGRMRPDRARRSRVVVLGVASVALMSVGPRILGHATDLVFAGLFSRDIPAGVTQAEAVAGAAASRARTSSPTCSPRWTTSCPGQGVDFAAVGDVLLLVLAVYAAASRARLAAGHGPQPRRAEHRLPDARRTSRTRSTGCR